MTLELPTELATVLQCMQAKLDGISSELTAFRSEMRGASTKPSETRASYTVEEVATLLGKRPYTVRSWCWRGQINATKRAERRGGSALWAVSADEVERYKNEGLLPVDPSRNTS